MLQAQPLESFLFTNRKPDKQHRCLQWKAHGGYVLNLGCTRVAPSWLCSCCICIDSLPQSLWSKQVSSLSSKPVCLRFPVKQCDMCPMLKLAAASTQCRLPPLHHLSNASMCWHTHNIFTCHIISYNFGPSELKSHKEVIIMSCDHRDTRSIPAEVRPSGTRTKANRQQVD